MAESAPIIQFRGSKPKRKRTLIEEFETGKRRRKRTGGTKTIKGGGSLTGGSSG